MPRPNPTGVFSGNYGTAEGWDYLIKLVDEARSHDPQGAYDGERATNWLYDQGLTTGQIKALTDAYGNEKSPVGQTTWDKEGRWALLKDIQGKREGDKAAAEASAKENADRAGITDNIQKFIDSMGIADPAISAQLQQRAQAQSSGMRGKAGLGSVGSYGGGGGLSAMGQQSINAGLDTQYAMQRAGLKSQALGVMNQRDISLSQLEQGYAQMQDARDGQKWAAQQNQNQGIGAGIGAAFGALGFIGGPALGAATMSGGASLGAGFAGLASGGGGPSYSAPSSISGNRGFRGGGTGSTGY
jgi:hypothetical protein